MRSRRERARIDCRERETERSTWNGHQSATNEYPSLPGFAQHSQSSSARLSIRSQPFPPAARGITESETAQAPSLYLDYSACPSQVAKKTKHKPPLFSPARTTTAPRVQLYILPYKRRRVRRSAGRYCAFCFVVSSLCVGPRRFFFYLC